MAEAVASAAVGAVICVPSGGYTLTAPVAPLTGQTIRGVGPHAPTLTCDAPLCFDGRGGGTDVTLSNLILQGATSADVRTADRWVVTHVSVQTAADSGLKVQGADVTLRDIYAVSDGRFGIVAKDADHLTIDGATILDSPADAGFGIAFSGGLKLNSVRGASIGGVHVRGGNGGAGIWIDNNTTDFARERQLRRGGPPRRDPDRDQLQRERLDEHRHRRRQRGPGRVQLPRHRAEREHRDRRRDVGRSGCS